MIISIQIETDAYPEGQKEIYPWKQHNFLLSK